MGRPSRHEWIVILVFLAVCTGWIIDAEAKNTALIALGGTSLLLLTGVLTWQDAVSEKGAWDVFIWYGGLVQMGKLLDQAGVFRVFAEAVVGQLGGLPLVLLFGGVLLVYFYAHYGFASITTHVLSMYPAFVAVLITAGAPPLLVVFCFAYFANFSAGLTHYGTTPAPIIFSLGYVSQRDWWRIGLLLSVFNVAIWLTVGVAWWKLWGLW
jgi:DASS family divalent anion:Na+ symporter